MDVKLSYWAALLFSGLALILTVANISLATNNRALQTTVSQRQQDIAAGQTLSQLNQNLVQAMAEAAFKNNNTQIRDLLASQGITLKSPPGSPPAPAKSTDKK